MCTTSLTTVAPERPRIRPRRRATPLESQPSNTLVLAPEQAIRVVTPNGQTLLAIAWTEHGPIIQLGQEDVALQAIGKLSIDARELHLTARGGDVVMRGEYIRLN